MNVKSDDTMLKAMEWALTRLMEGAAKMDGKRVTKLILDTTATKDMKKIRAVAKALVAEVPGTKKLVDLWVLKCEGMEDT